MEMEESGKENIKTSESSKPSLKDTKHKESLHKNMTKHHLRFLEDSPVPVDELGSHENIAKTLFNIIRKQKGGKAIALIGKWGSGKSLLIDERQKVNVEFWDIKARASKKLRQMQEDKEKMIKTDFGKGGVKWVKKGINM